MKRLLLFISLITYLACEESNLPEAGCKANNPIQDLAWLAEIKSNLEKLASPAKKYIHQYTYNKETVFFVEFCFQCPDAQSYVYNCTGKEICRFGGISGENTCPDFAEKARDTIILWEK